MEDRKGQIKRYVGRIEVDTREGRVADSAFNGLREKGYEVITQPIHDNHGMIIGEVAEIYWVE